MSEEKVAEEIQEDAAEAEAVENGQAAPESTENGEAEEQAPPTVEEQLDAALAEAADFKDRWMRSQAEFANARKRMEKQRLDTYTNATASVMDKLLPIVDDFERAMENLPEEISENSWLEGIQLMQRKLLNTLENFNVIAIEALGEPFDPNLHEAVTQEPTDEFESGAVCRVLQTGYKIGDRVIRPSLVVVAA
ncbi:nucleotide exchange factor GrpE [Candidatus Leptofilum sp.]|uniref:nucleotide exchange factor GrpE n=1 Tax=Candidatus Leptofilum sp. TaxID=3241576 RepID=UPI003B5C0789